MLLSDSIKEKLLSEIKFSASRSSGPGGQNVNKLNTKIELRFLIPESKNLSDEQKSLILIKLKNRINANGELIITSSAKRTQLLNKEESIRKFFLLIEKSLTIPPKRKRTKPSRSSRKKRLENKKRHGIKKQLRKPPQI